MQRRRKKGEKKEEKCGGEYQARSSSRALRRKRERKNVSCCCCCSAPPTFSVCAQNSAGPWPSEGGFPIAPPVVCNAQPVVASPFATPVRSAASNRRRSLLWIPFSWIFLFASSLLNLRRKKMSSSHHQQHHHQSRAVSSSAKFKFNSSGSRRVLPSVNCTSEELSRGAPRRVLSEKEEAEGGKRMASSVAGRPLVRVPRSIDFCRSSGKMCVVKAVGRAFSPLINKFWGAEGKKTERERADY